VIRAAALAMVVLLMGCAPARMTPDQALDLIHADAERDWCGAEVDGAPILRAELYGELCL
jgi:hypothetical protein